MPNNIHFRVIRFLRAKRIPKTNGANHATRKRKMPSKMRVIIYLNSQVKI